MNTPKETNSSQLRGYRTLLALFGHEITGIECQELAKQLESSRGTVHRDLSTLQKAGLAEQLPNKNWRITPLIGRQAIKMLNHIQETQQRVDETIARYTR
ncbi:MAG: HTH domain-containing protein [Gammaproteobacteria bacterium]|nr:HTH domain-containing protein [Gammaproteobacteria bacterium]